MTDVITKGDLLSWLRQLTEKYTLIAPLTSNGVTRYEFVNSSEINKINLNFSNTDLSPKNWFFPPSETLFTIVKDEVPKIIPASIDQEAILFGLRPCDAKGIALTDKPFLAEPTDVFYKERRDKTILIGLACSTARSECFCTNLGGGPADPTYLDVLLTETPGGYIIQVTTGKGKGLLTGAPLQKLELSPPSPPTVNPVPVEGITEIMSRVFNDSYWERVADRCIHCNICAYVCPCCYCFDIRDYVSKDKIERVRSWESCQSPGFTRMAGGYDPRSTKGAHLRQRWYHKFLYFPERFGDIKCTGCGRCVRSCPVNIDIREIIADVQGMRA